MTDGPNDVMPAGIRPGWAPAHAWRWFLLRSAKHVPKATRDQPEWKSLGASFFAILQAVGQAANEDGTNAFLGTDTLMAIGRCSKETVQKVLVAAEAVCLIRKTANARGGRHPKPATYACTLPLGADTETGHGIAWGEAAAVLSSSEHDRRLRHKRAKGPERHVMPPDRSPVQELAASCDGPVPAGAEVEVASHDAARERHVTGQKASPDAPTRFHPAFHQEMDEAVDQPQVDGALPSAIGRGRPLDTAAVPAGGHEGGRASAVAESNYTRHVASCDRCPREMWCPQGSRLRKYLVAEQNHKRARYLGGPPG
ncbi:hypothetical protein GCM10010302_04620 [Streptomyces polychromogenes]|uniref:Replication protein n=1 Tax=Streptomyces polychromogenes TaxID=67342 RepID=A0ABN0V134_9ACTN